MQVEYLVTSEEMKQYDANTIDTLGIPGMVLMERAALGAFSLIEEKFREREKSGLHVLIMAGMGNNGGDGLALARLLSEAEYQVTVFYVGNPQHATEQWKNQKKILEHFPVKICDKMQEQEYTIMVDALFGVGLSREIEGDYARAVAAFNKADAYKLALDIPSGIHTDTGAVMGCAVQADMTVTFGFYKRGILLEPGKSYAGEVKLVQVGITERSFLGREPGLFFYQDNIQGLLPKRNPDGNKGTFGKVLLIAGTPKMAGAAVLSARAAYRIGAGMVKVITQEENRILMQSSVPEALFGTAEDLDKSMEWADVVAIGPGLGLEPSALKLLESVVRRCSLPLLIDADGLNLLAENKTLLDELAGQGRDGRPIILTPHVGELSRLTGKSVPVLKENLLGSGKALARQLHAIVVAKDARTFTCRPEGSDCVNLRGNSGMATAGSGDVLTGMIIGLLAQKMDAFSAASIGVSLHACAGDMVAGKIGEHACMAGDIINEIQPAIQGIKAEQEMTSANR